MTFDSPIASKCSEVQFIECAFFCNFAEVRANMRQIERKSVQNGENMTIVLEILIMEGIGENHNISRHFDKRNCVTFQL